VGAGRSASLLVQAPMGLDVISATTEPVNLVFTNGQQPDVGV
jgi:hypothetical protein